MRKRTSKSGIIKETLTFFGFSSAKIAEILQEEEKNEEAPISDCLDRYLVPFIAEKYNALQEPALAQETYKRKIEFTALVQLCFEGNLSPSAWDSAWAIIPPNKRPSYVYGSGRDNPLLMAARNGNLQNLRRLNRFYQEVLLQTDRTKEQNNGFRANQFTQSREALREILFVMDSRSTHDKEIYDYLLHMIKLHAASAGEDPNKVFAEICKDYIKEIHIYKQSFQSRCQQAIGEISSYVYSISKKAEYETFKTNLLQALETPPQNENGHESQEDLEKTIGWRNKVKDMLNNPNQFPVYNHWNEDEFSVRQAQPESKIDLSATQPTPLEHKDESTPHPQVITTPPQPEPTIDLSAEQPAPLENKVESTSYQQALMTLNKNIETMKIKISTTNERHTEKEKKNIKKCIEQTEKLVRRVEKERQKNPDQETFLITCLTQTNALLLDSSPNALKAYQQFASDSAKSSSPTKKVIAGLMMALGVSIAALGIASLVVTLGLSTAASAGVIATGVTLTGAGAGLWKKSKTLPDNMGEVAEARKKMS